MSETRAPSRRAAMPRHSASSVTRISSVTSCRHVADRHRDRGVAVPAVDDRSAVDRDDVAIGEHAGAGDAVHDLVVDRGADDAGEARGSPRKLEVRALRPDVIVRDDVELGGRHTGLHAVAQQLQRRCDHEAGLRASTRSEPGS